MPRNKQGRERERNRERQRDIVVEGGTSDCSIYAEHL